MTEKLIIEKETLNLIVGYLGSRPYAEVFRILDKINNVVIYKEPEDPTHSEK